MMLHPSSLDELAQLLASAHQAGERVASMNLSALNQVLEHTPEDMTVTVQTGITLAALQAHLAKSRQWLPIDPPGAETTAIGKILANNSSGPRRFGYGTIREHLIGLRVALADGRVIKNGGKVVKNVAGYDLCKLFVGDHGSLGVVVEAAFKLRPLPEAEHFVLTRTNSLERAATLVEGILKSELTPVVLDLHNLPSPNSQITTILGFAGTGEEVEWQLARARELGVKEPADLEYEKRFWADTAAAETHRLSVLPSRLLETLCRLGDVPFVARAGNGVIYYRGGPLSPRPEPQPRLAQQIKDAFDPKHIFPPWPA